jgi:GT2 family glycosyltransferase
MAKLSVYIIDNSQPSQDFAFKPSFFCLQVIKPSTNLGYFGGVEYAMRQIDPIKFDYIIISNVDVLLTEDSIINLCNANCSSDIGWIAPSLRSKTANFDWNPQAIRRYPIKKLKIMRFLFKHPYLLRLKQIFLHKYKHHNMSSSGDIYAGHGSFIILTKNYFMRCGIIHYPVFLYFEEIYLAEECKRSQLKVVYMPSIHVFDIGSVSTGKIPSKTYCKYNYEGINYIISNYY